MVSQENQEESHIPWGSLYFGTFCDRLGAEPLDGAERAPEVLSDLTLSFVIALSSK